MNVSTDILLKPAPEAPENRPQQRRSAGQISPMRIARHGFMAATLLLVILIIAAPKLVPTHDRLRLAGELPVIDMGGVLNVVVDAKYLGSDNKGRPYKVVADTIREIEDNPDHLALQAPVAELTLAGGGHVTLVADDGIYNTKTEIIDLSGTVTLNDERGYHAETTAATIDLNAGDAHGNEPTVGTGPFGRIHGEGFRVSDKGDRIVFTGRSNMILDSRHPPTLR